MAGKTLIFLIMAGVMGVGWFHQSAGHGSKRVIGQTAKVGIAEASMEFIGRVDTGAATTSMHAESIQVDGDMVSFTLTGEDGRQIYLCQPIARKGTVRNAARSEERIFVELTLTHEGRAKQVLVNLNNRSGLTYPILLGRNWLQDEYLVDVSNAPPQPSSNPEAGPQEFPGLASQ
jgi:hypothetical protein